jgi:uncharacterized membrane protein YqhA
MKINSLRRKNKLSTNPVNYAIKWGIAMIIVATLGITGLSMYINATATGSSEMDNASPTIVMIVGTLVILLACLGLALAFMPPELKSKIGLWVKPYANTEVKSILASNGIWC